MRVGLSTRSLSTGILIVHEKRISVFHSSYRYHTIQERLTTPLHTILLGISSHSNSNKGNLELQSVSPIRIHYTTCLKQNDFVSD